MDLPAPTKISSRWLDGAARISGLARYHPHLLGEKNFLSFGREKSHAKPPGTQRKSKNKVFLAFFAILARYHPHLLGETILSCGGKKFPKAGFVSNIN
jgi:hypothetical protein